MKSSEEEELEVAHLVRLGHASCRICVICRTRLRVVLGHRGTPEKMIMVVLVAHEFFDEQVGKRKGCEK
jgi:hypothetical protein